MGGSEESVHLTWMGRHIVHSMFRSPFPRVMIGGNTESLGLSLAVLAVGRAPTAPASCLQTGRSPKELYQRSVHTSFASITRELTKNRGLINHQYRSPRYEVLSPIHACALSDRLLGRNASGPAVQMVSRAAHPFDIVTGLRTSFRYR
jgi:hypothetical protein